MAQWKEEVNWAIHFTILRRSRTFLRLYHNREAPISDYYISEISMVYIVLDKIYIHECCISFQSWLARCGSHSWTATGGICNNSFYFCLLEYRSYCFSEDCSWKQGVGFIQFIKFLSFIL